MLYPQLQEQAKEFTTTFKAIPEKRREVLRSMASYIQERLNSGEKVRLIFICTHNSRRSHMAQLWAQVAAYYYQLAGVFTYSGGTEESALNKRAVWALERTGFKVAEVEMEANPVYSLWYAKEEPPLKAFSKIYNAPPNPQSNFAAVMTCSDADEGCPYIPGASIRFSLPYDDPKQFDDSPQEEEKYLERVVQIGREMFYTFSLIKEEKGKKTS